MKGLTVKSMASGESLQARRTWGPSWPGGGPYSAPVPGTMEKWRPRVTRSSQFLKVNKKSRHLCELCSNSLKGWTWGGGIFHRRITFGLWPPQFLAFGPGHKKLGLGLNRSSGENRLDQPPWKQPRFCPMKAPWLRQQVLRYDTESINN